MTCSKNLVIAGTKVVVDNRGTGLNSQLCLTKVPGGYFDGHVYPAVGDEVEILSKPKKYDGINCVKVQYKGAELFAYYTQIRYSTTPKQ